MRTCFTLLANEASLPVSTWDFSIILLKTAMYVALTVIL